MKFDVVVMNPPYQDREVRGRTPHKLWIDFVLRAFDDWLADDGLVAAVTPSSFRSPNSKVLGAFRRHRVDYIETGGPRYFPDVAVDIAFFQAWKSPGGLAETTLVHDGKSRQVRIDEGLAYLPSDPSPLAVSIHKKVMFQPGPRLGVLHDYVTCHNVLRHRDGSVGPDQSDELRYPVLHTNRQTWWSSRRQEWADLNKVMWSRSGYTQPFFDPGVLGGTDMAYFVPVADRDEGEALVATMSGRLFTYIFATARWSGFGNERVFEAIPDLPRDRPLSDDELYVLFGLSGEEVAHIERAARVSRHPA